MIHTQTLLSSEDVGANRQRVQYPPTTGDSHTPSQNTTTLNPRLPQKPQKVPQNAKEGNQKLRTPTPKHTSPKPGVAPKILQGHVSNANGFQQKGSALTMERIPISTPYYCSVQLEERNAMVK